MVLITAPADGFRGVAAVEGQPPAPVSVTLAMSATLEADDSLASMHPVAGAARVAPPAEQAAAEGARVAAATKGTPWAIVLAATATTLAGVLAVGWWIAAPARNSPAAAAVNGEPAITATESESTGAAPAIEVAGSEPNEVEAPLPQAPETTPVAAASPVVEDAAEATAPTTSAADEVAPPLPPEPDPPAATPTLTGDADANRTAGPPDPAGLLIRDPLDIDPATVGLILRRSPSTPPGALKGEPQKADDEGAVAGDPAERVALDLDERLAEVGKAGAVRVERGPTGDPASSLPAIPAAAALETPLPAAQLTDAPLWGAVALLGEVAGVPISIDPAALAAAGVSANDRVSLAFTGGTAGDALRTLLAPVRLDWESDGSYAMVVRREKPGPSTRTVDHRVGDLSDVDDQRLAAVLRTIGPPGVAAPVEGIVDGRWSIDAPNRAHYELLVVCERLRVARGLAPLTSYARGLLATKPALAELGPLLSRSTTISFAAPTPLADVFEHLRRATGLTILVDWRSLAGVSLGPATTITASANHRPWVETLDGLLGPLGLGWGALDARTLWIASRGRIAGQEFVEFYPLATAAEAESLAQALRSINPPPRAIADAPSRSVIVRGDASAQRAAHAAWQAALGGRR
jgi:hypothetical protein